MGFEVPIPVRESSLTLAWYRIAASKRRYKRTKGKGLMSLSPLWTRIAVIITGQATTRKKHSVPRAQPDFRRE